MADTGDSGDNDDGVFQQMRQRLQELQLEHRDLDAAIQRLSDDTLHDQLALQRLKKRKLLLKDQIAWLERQMDPDIRA